MSPCIKLTCCDAVASLKRLSIKQFPFTIGRGQEADATITDCWASRVHARFEFRPDGLYVVDLNSSNGTLVNTAPISEQRLEVGDRVTIGVTTYEIAAMRPPRRSALAPHTDAAARFESESLASA